MMDFAEIKSISQENISQTGAKAEETIKTKSISIHPAFILPTVAFAIVVYLAGYQNMLISKAKHQINIKKNMLNSLILEKQNLAKIEASLTRPSAFLGKKFTVANYHNITIVSP